MTALVFPLSERNEETFNVGFVHTMHWCQFQLITYVFAEDRNDISKQELSSKIVEH